MNHYEIVLSPREALPDGIARTNTEAWTAVLFEIVTESGASSEALDTGAGRTPAGALADLANSSYLRERQP